MRGIRKVDAKFPDVCYGGRAPVGNVKFREPIYREKSAIFVSHYSVGITVFMAIGTGQPVELTFTRRQALDLVSCLSDALETAPDRGKRWTLVGTVNYSISDWDDPTLDRPGGSVLIESRLMDGKCIFRIRPRIGQYYGEPYGEPDPGVHELTEKALRNLMKLLNKAASAQKAGRTGLDVEHEKKAGTPPRIPEIKEGREKGKLGTRGVKYFTSTLEFFEIIYRRKSAFYVASFPELTSIFIDVGIDGSGMGGDIEIMFDPQKQENLVGLLKESLQTARRGPEDWERVGSADYTICDWDDPRLEDPHGYVTVDARVGRIRLNIHADPRGELGDWPMVIELKSIEELIALLEELRLRNKSKPR